MPFCFFVFVLVAINSLRVQLLGLLMTVEINVTSDVKEWSKALTRLQKKQLPFATALSLTRTAQDASRSVTNQLPKKLDRPTPFTRKAIGFKSANKRDLTAAVFVKDIQAGYLEKQIEGGRRVARGKGFGVPTRNKRLNKFGNIPGRRKGLARGKREFIGTIRGVSGVWQRTGGTRNPGLKLMVAFEKVVKYKKRLPFFKIVNGVVRSRFSKNFSSALQRALRTAR